MIDHMSLRVRDLEKSKAFYLAALAPLGYTAVMEFPGVVGFGEGGKADFWIGSGEVGPITHIAFRAQTHEIVDAFYKAAMAAGGKDNGPPGLRPHYHVGYYGAFVRDLDGNNIEAVCHAG